LGQSEDYDLFAHEAHLIIDQLVNQSLAHVNDTDDINDEKSNTQRDRFIELENEAKTPGQTSVQWPTIAQFTDAKIGVEKINEYIEKVSQFRKHNLTRKKDGLYFLYPTDGTQADRSFRKIFFA